MTDVEKPTLIEVGVSVSTGGKVQLKKFELSSDYFLNVSGKWSVPPTMTEEDAESFRNEMILRLRSELEPIAQAEVDELLEQKANLAD